jgi:hypothetical protein
MRARGGDRGLPQDSPMLLQCHNRYNPKFGSAVSMRWSALLPVAILIGMALAGCLDLDDSDPVKTGDEGSKSRGDDRIDLEELEGGTPDEWNATLDESPKWRLGQWWEFRLTEHFTGESHETTVAVAGAERDWFLTGMPRDHFDHAIMVLHMPGVGQIAKDTLAWDIHDEMFHPLKFPLTEGDSWDTMWNARAVQADVVEVTETTATVEFIGNSDHFTLTYDAEVGTIVHLEQEGYATLELIDHGFEYEGVVTVPHEHDLIFFHGRLAGVVGIGFQDMEPHPPVETITVGGDYDRVSFGLILAGLTPGGIYAVEATAPDGSTYQAQLIGTEENEISIYINSNNDPVGDWDVTFAAAGLGMAMIEGIGYHVFDIELPSGCLLGAMDDHAHHGGGDHMDGC